MPPGFLNRDISLQQASIDAQAVETTDGDVVPLEPDFTATLRPDAVPTVDDGRVPNRISRIFGSGRSTTLAAIHDTGESRRLPSRAPAEPGELFFCRVGLPTNFKLKPVQIEQFLESLMNSLTFAAFEVIANETEISFQFTGRKGESDVLERQLRSHLPEFDVSPSQDALKWIEKAPREHSSVIRFDVADHWFIPTPSQRDTDAELFIPLAAALDGVGKDEFVCLQVMFARTRYPWQQAVRDELFDSNGKNRYSNFSDQTKAIRQKLSDPLAAVRIRLLVKASGREASTGLARQLMPYFKQFGGTECNSLVPLRPGSRSPDTAENVLARTSHASGFLLSVPELSSLVRFPSDAVKSAKLRRNAKVEKRAPEVTSYGTIVLGHNSYQNEDREVRLSPEQRTRHMHVIGASGSGKTTLLLSLAKSDIESDDASCIVVDPHGDLIDAVMANVPEACLKDVVLFDPSDAEFPIGFNILQANSPVEKTILSSDLVATFRRMATSWGDVMDSVLANTVLAFLESTRGGTLFDLRRFLVEKEFREDFLLTVTDESVRYFWEHEFQLIAGKPQASILIRLDMFLRQSLIRNIVCQKENKLDFRRLMDQKKIILIKLSQGLIGEENAHLLGTMILSRIYQAALSRQDTQDRPYCWLSVDEFHHLVTPSLESVLSGARKYNLGLTLGHQQFKQIQTRSQDVASSVLSNCYTRVCFRLGDNDAEKFASGFSSFDAKALQNLGVGEAIARIERADYDFNLNVAAVPIVDRDLAKTRTDAIREFSRSTYGRPRSEVEDELRTTRANADIDKKSAAKPRRVEAQAVATSDDFGMHPGREEPSNVAMQVAGEHAYLQRIIKRIGERYGYRATIEQPVLGGIGKVDVALENDASRIAMEIANTNTTGYEVQNIQKCLAAQFDRVVVVSTSASHLNEIRTIAQATLSDAQLLKTSFMDPANIHLFLERLQQQEQARSTSHKVKGYRVNTTYAKVSEVDAELIAQNLTDLLGPGGNK